MIISGVHWIFATGIAVSIHLAGMMWLSLSEPVRQVKPEQASKGIVVTLGRHAGSPGDSADTIDPEQSAVVTESREVDAERAQAATDAPEAAEVGEPTPEEAAPEQAETAATPDAAEPATRIEPDTTDLSRPSASGPVRPQTDDTAAPEPRTVESRQASDAASPQPPESPQASVSLEPQAAAEAPPAPPRPVSAAVQAAETEDARPTVEIEPPPDAGDAVPVEFADTATVPETPEAPETVVEPETPAVSAPAGPAQPVAAPSAPTPASAVEDVAAVQSSESATVMHLEPVEATPAAGENVAISAARQPAPQVEPASAPEITTTAVPETGAAAVPEAGSASMPETVNLQELQEREGGGSGVVARYAGVVKGWLQKNMHYPRAARLAGQEGEVVVRFVIDREGRVQSVDLESGSGFDLLDREAREMIERGDPFPAMPAEMPGQRLEVRVPVSFHVKDRTRTKEIPPIYLE